MGLNDYLSELHKSYNIYNLNINNQQNMENQILMSDLKQLISEE